MIVLGGLYVDPGYKGPLYIGLYNIASTPFTLHLERKLISGMFVEVDKSIEYTPEPMSEDGFPSDLINLIQQYSPVNLGGMQTELERIKNQLNAIQAQLDDDSRWREDIRESIDDLLKGLEGEREARTKHIEELEKDIENRISNVEGNIKTSEKVADSSKVLNARWIGWIFGVVGSIFGAYQFFPINHPCAPGYFPRR